MYLRIELIDDIPGQDTRRMNLFRWDAHLSPEPRSGERWASLCVNFTGKQILSFVLIKCKTVCHYIVYIYKMKTCMPRLYRFCQMSSQYRAFFQQILYNCVDPWAIMKKWLPFEELQQICMTTRREHLLSVHNTTWYGCYMNMNMNEFISNKHNHTNT